MEAQGLFARVSQRVPMGLLESQGVKYFIYILAAGIGIATVLLVVDYYYPFLPINPVSGPSPAARAGKRFWPESEENLIVPAAASPIKKATNYSVRFTMNIDSAQVPRPNVLQHILHRGQNPCGLTASAAGPTGVSGMDPTNGKLKRACGSAGATGGLKAPTATAAATTTFDPTNLGELTDYVSTGIPDIVNPGCFLDPYKNDMYIFIHTHGHEDSRQMLWLESTVVEDLPLNTPIDVGIVCNGRVVEVYINCKLYSTWMLRGEPYLPAALNDWFGLYCAYPMAGNVKDLTLWGTALNSTDFMMVCRSK
jgi:hypothetical protein